MNAAPKQHIGKKAGKSPATNVARSSNPTKKYRPAKFSDLVFADLYTTPAPERVELIREGVFPQDLKDLATQMGISQDRLSNYVHVPAATFTRKAARQERLSTEVSERVIGVATLIGQVESMVERSGGSLEGFDAAVWTARWLEEPLPALGGLKPASYLDTLEGQRLVSNLLETMVSGAYS